MTRNNSINAQIPENNIIIGNGVDGYSGLDPSTAGYLLSSNGSSSTPSFEPPVSNGGLTLISNQTVTNASSIVFNNLYNACSTYVLYFFQVYASSLSATQLVLSASSNNGATWNTTGNNTGIQINTISSATLVNQSSTSNAIIVGSTTDLNTTAGYVYLFNVAKNQPLSILGQCSFFYNLLGSAAMGNFGGQIDENNVNAIKVQFTVGNIAYGTFSLYGIIPT